MKIYLLSLGAGLLVGMIYSLLNVRSPAPPVLALIGLLGILVGEQLVPLAKSHFGSRACRRLLASSGQAAHVRASPEGRDKMSCRSEHPVKIGIEEKLMTTRRTFLGAASSLAFSHAFSNGQRRRSNQDRSCLHVR